LSAQQRDLFMFHFSSGAAEKRKKKKDLFMFHFSSGAANAANPMLMSSAR